MADPVNYKTLFASAAEAYDADVLVYWGDIQRPEDDWLYSQCRTRRKRRNIILVLTTRGGDPHVAYRIARCLQMAYKTEEPVRGGVPVAAQQGPQRGTFTVLVNSKCKSAGTILALGANKIWMSENAEFGPIDVQLRKPDEVGERTSSLTPMAAISALQNYALGMFKGHFSRLRFDDDLLFSTKMAGELATTLATGLLGPVFAQIDPMRMAEVERSLRISAEYGERLAHNLKDGALAKLVGSYPSHNFVIDRRESEEQIFKTIEDISRRSTAIERVSGNCW